MKNIKIHIYAHLITQFSVHGTYIRVVLSLYIYKNDKDAIHIETSDLTLWHLNHLTKSKRSKIICNYVNTINKIEMTIKFYRISRNHNRKNHNFEIIPSIDWFFLSYVWDLFIVFWVKISNLHIFIVKNIKRRLISLQI